MHNLHNNKHSPATSSRLRGSENFFFQPFIDDQMLNYLSVGNLTFVCTCHFGNCYFKRIEPGPSRNFGFRVNL